MSQAETVNFQDRDETETFHFSKLSRLRWDETFNFQDRDETETLETTLSQFKNTNWWSLSLDNLFLAGQIHYFLPDPQAWCIASMFTRPKVTKPETETLYLQDRDETEMLNPQDRDVRFFQTLKTETRPRRSKKRLETVLRARRSRPRLHPCSIPRIW